jgi:hypothetical protein
MGRGRRSGGELVTLEKISPIDNKLTFLSSNWIPPEDGNAFLDDFSSAETLTVEFQTGNEPKWNFKMAGSKGAIKAFRTCVSDLGATQATSPVSPETQVTSPIPDSKEDDNNNKTDNSNVTPPASQTKGSNQ